MLSAKTSVPFLNKKLASPESVTRVHTKYKPSFLSVTLPVMDQHWEALHSCLSCLIFHYAKFSSVVGQKKNLYLNVHISVQNMLVLKYTSIFNLAITS